MKCSRSQMSSAAVAEGLCKCSGTCLMQSGHLHSFTPQYKVNQSSPRACPNRSMMRWSSHLKVLVCSEHLGHKVQLPEFRGEPGKRCGRKDEASCWKRHLQEERMKLEGCLQQLCLLQQVDTRLGCLQPKSYSNERVPHHVWCEHRHSIHSKDVREFQFL